jgi:hypothetical protein
MGAVDASHLDLDVTPDGQPREKKQNFGADPVR